MIEDVKKKKTINNKMIERYLGDEMSVRIKLKDQVQNTKVFLY